ncbi:MAG TPA: deoxyguanosinetriphosphate triphosphohydrolase [Rhodospirillaceae bacterium]|nr:deoxyguanosinetriphosphate triphosphohydrolase [Rhodospirillaceae bacterium]
MHTTLAPFASRAEASRGRLHAEPESRYRSCFQRDRDRIVHATAFRRLKHKTQVFISPGGDHYRTRLTHSLEVAQIARALARALRLDEDLTEALALAHDLGHPPFGHAGEEALDRCMSDFGGFDHNDQTLRILIKLEHRYAAFDGLNLSWEALEGVVKHNGPLVAESSENPVPPTIAAYNKKQDLELDLYSSLESQIASLADDIAYDNHDLDDGLRAGIIEIEMLQDVPHVAEMFRSVSEQYDGIEMPRLIHESIRRLIDHTVQDLIEQTERNLEVAKVETTDDIRKYGQQIAGFAGPIAGEEGKIKSFLFKNMYLHPAVLEQAAVGAERLRDLFELFHGEPERMPPEWADQAGEPNSSMTARVVADYIAGMTDRYAIHLHRSIFTGDAT